MKLGFIATIQKPCVKCNQWKHLSSVEKKLKTHPLVSKLLLTIIRDFQLPILETFIGT
jgi:hypothetical protein